MYMYSIAIVANSQKSTHYYCAHNNMKQQHTTSIITGAPKVGWPRKIQRPGDEASAQASLVWDLQDQLQHPCK